MQENVGRTDRIVRSIVGPAVAGFGIDQLRRGNLVLGGIGIAVGALVTESAVTRVCPMNALLGIDTRSQVGALRKSLKTFQKQTRDVKLQTPEAARLA
jgi:hypothetical protein